MHKLSFLCALAVAFACHSLGSTSPALGIDWNSVIKVDGQQLTQKQVTELNYHFLKVRAWIASIRSEDLAHNLTLEAMTNRSLDEIRVLADLVDVDVVNKRVIQDIQAEREAIQRAILNKGELSSVVSALDGPDSPIALRAKIRQNVFEISKKNKK